MAKIFEFKKPEVLSQESEAPEEPTLSGKAFCLCCKHEWVAVAPVGFVWLECPQCGTFKGTWQGTIAESGPHWTCSCDCQLFYISLQRIYCVQCGLPQEF